MLCAQALTPLELVLHRVTGTNMAGCLGVVWVPAPMLVGPFCASGS